MGKIAIVDIDSKIPNLALKKIEKYHLDGGDQVMWNPLPLWENTFDKVYVSCVFTDNRTKATKWEGLAEIGGSGYDLKKRLPPEIESVKPRINLGFATRGCIRKCDFCIVPEKEGSIRIVGELLDLWDGKSREVTLLDNNILAVPDHFKLICRQARENGIRVDFNQGLDHRLLSEEIIHELRSIRHKEYRFAFDQISDLDTVETALDMLIDNGLKRSFWYVLVGYNTTFAQDLWRLDYLRGRNQTVFVQRYRKTKGNLLLGQWANQHALFKAMNFWQFLQLSKYKAYRVKYADEVDFYLEGGSHARVQENQQGSI